MPPKKGKGKKGGAKGPTAEEKVQALMARLQEEAKLSILSLQKLNFDQMKKQRKDIGKELRKDIHLAQVNFDKVLKIKSKIIQSLADDLNNSMEQSKEAQDSHQEFQKKLQELQVIRLAALEQLWRGSQEELYAEFNTEREEMLAQHRQEIDYLRDVTEVMRKRDEDTRFNAQLNYQSLTNALQRLQITKNDLAHKHILDAARKEERILAGEIKRDEDTYEKAEAEFKVALKAMEARCCTKSIQRQGRRLQRLQAERDAMVRRAVTGNGENGKAVPREQETAERRANAASVGLRATRIKVRMSRERAAARSRLTRLVMNTSSAEKKLRDTRTKGERLLFRAQMCAKIDREQARSQRRRSAKGDGGEEEPAAAASSALVPPPPPVAQPPPKDIAEAMAEYRELEQFWHRYNKVRLEQLYLKKQEMALKRENRYLHAVMRYHSSPFY